MKIETTITNNKERDELIQKLKSIDFKEKKDNDNNIHTSRMS